MFKFINLDPNVSEFIYGRKLLSVYKHKPRVFVEILTNGVRYQFPYWEGDALKKHHIKQFREYCSRASDITILSKYDDGTFRTLSYTTVYYGQQKLKIFEKYNEHGQRIQLSILEIFDWSICNEVKYIADRMTVRNLKTDEVRISNPELFDTMVAAIDPKLQNK